MVFPKRTWLLVLFLLTLVCAIAFYIIQVSQTEKLYPITVLQKGYGSKTENLYPVQFYMRGVRSGYAYVNQAAHMIVEPQFKFAGEFSEGFAPIRVNQKWGFINLQGQIIIPPQYDKVGESDSPYGNDDSNFFSSSFSEGLAGVKLNGKWGFINQKNELIIPYQYDKVQRFSGGVATVKENGLWGVINSEGKWIIQPVDEHPIRFFQGITRLNLISWDKSWRLIGDPNIYWDKSGRSVGNFYNPPQLAKEFHEELAIIQISQKDFPPEVITSEYSSYPSNKCGFQDKQGKVVIEPQFYGCKSFSQGLAVVGVKKLENEVDLKWGYIDKTGKFVVNPQFDYADGFFDERALVVSNGKVGFIDRTGKVIINPQFDPSSGFIFSSDTKRDSEYLKLKFKKYPQQLEFNEVRRHRFSHGLAVVAKDNRCGYIDKTGKFAIQPEFTGCEPFDRYGVAKVYRRGYDGFYVTSDGKIFPQMITPASFSNFYPARIKLLASVMACLLWIIAISCHEFGHAIVAYWGGDRSVKDKGYLSFNPRRYFNPLHSIILPAFFVVIGGIPLPGAAVYIEFNAIRNRWWSSATAAAGPLSSILFGLLLVPVFHFSQAWNFPHWFSAFIGVFINLQFVIALFNLLPVPPLDGYRIFSVWLPPKLQDCNGIASIIGLFFICFLLPFIPTVIFPILEFAKNFMLVLEIPEEFSIGGWYLLERLYIILPLLVAGLAYLIYKPDKLKANQEVVLAWEENNLYSDVSFEYTRLRNLLAAQKWEEADEETITVMLQATGREVSYEFIHSLPVGMFIKYFPYPEFSENIPCSVLDTIDQLWVKYSNRRFGFSVQKLIWDSVGHNSEKFGDRVGWKKGWWMNKHWIKESELTFDTSAPVGHLPWKLGWVMEWSRVYVLCGCIFPAERAVWARAHYEARFAMFSRIQACESLQPAVPTVRVSVPDNLSSDSGVDYTRLCDLLATGNWKDADYETYLVMLRVVGRQKGDWIRSEELLNFPCTDLRTIDSLWVKYSNGRFGFSVQKKIYLEVGGKPDGKYYEEAWKKFVERVGWKKRWSEKYRINYSEVLFNTSATEGHLPAKPFALIITSWGHLPAIFRIVPAIYFKIEHDFLNFSSLLSRPDL